MKARAAAKVNLGLRVRSARTDGYHPLVSLGQSVDWFDEIGLERHESDDIEVTGGAAPADESNLAWRAVEALRRGPKPTVRLTLDKRIPIAAGLGGGSADAAASLALAAELLGRTDEEARREAVELGADVPFCFLGGSAWMEGAGERLTTIETLSGFWMALAVPDFELSTPSVYRRWDELNEPEVGGLDGRDLPMALRPFGPIGNDLTPAAVDLVPALGDWMSDVESAWGQPVLLSGSGSTVIGFFATESEAWGALDVVEGVRALRAVQPIGYGWQIVQEGDR